MNNNQLLLESIKHWERLQEYTNEEDILREGLSTQDCALCLEYNNVLIKTKDNNCIGCPIATDTHKRYCKDTPYEPALKYYDTVYEGALLNISKWHKLCQAEIDYLKSLIKREVKDANKK